MRQGDPHDMKPLGGHVAVGQSAEQRIGGVKPSARQGEMKTELTRRAGQKESAADIGHETDAGFGHGEDRAFGDDPVGSMGPKPDPAAHGHAVHHAHDRLREAGQTGVEVVFRPKEIRYDRPLSGLGGLVERANIATGTKGAVSGAVDQYGRDLGVDLPAVERRVDEPSHGDRQGIIGLGAVQREVAEHSLPARHDVGFGNRLPRSRHGVGHSQVSVIDCTAYRSLTRFAVAVAIRRHAAASGSPMKMPLGSPARRRPSWPGQMKRLRFRAGVWAVGRIAVVTGAAILA